MRSRHSISFGLVLGVVALPLASCAGKGAVMRDLAAVRAAVDAGNAGWIDAFRRGDAAALVQVFAEDGVLLRQSGEVARGREEIRGLMQPTMDSLGPTETTIETDRLWCVDDLAYETGRYSYSFTKDGEPQVAAGRFVVVWRHVGDGVWKIQADMGLPDD